MNDSKKKQKPTPSANQSYSSIKSSSAHKQPTKKQSTPSHINLNTSSASIKSSASKQDSKVKQSTTVKN